MSSPHENQVHAGALLELGTRAGNDAIQLALLSAKIKMLEETLAELQKDEGEVEGGVH